jgi:hypothetical protein
MKLTGLLPRARVRERLDGNLRSAIVNCICPECGGALRISRNHFRCRGRCGKDWRPAWNRLCSPRLPARQIRRRPVHRSARPA